MKQKVLKKKLALNKNTIADLNISQMNAVRGGETADPGCETVTCQNCTFLECVNTNKCQIAETYVSECICLTISPC